MKSGNFEISKGLLAYIPDMRGPHLTDVPPEKWARPDFIPKTDGSGKDRFGNRIHYSPDFAYTDRRDTVVRAGILLSPEGQELIRDLPGCLRQLDNALHQITEDTFSKIEFTHGSLTNMAAPGFQSKVYLWETSTGGKYILKVPHPKPELIWGIYRVDQPYINEMLITQELAKILQEQSRLSGVTLSTFLFASPTVSCTKFEEGEHPVNWLHLGKKMKPFSDALRHQVASLKDSGNRLYRDIEADIDNEPDLPSVRNVILKPDGSMVWIDPVIDVGSSFDE